MIRLFASIGRLLVSNTNSVSGKVEILEIKILVLNQNKKS